MRNRKNKMIKTWKNKIIVKKKKQEKINESTNINNFDPNK